MFVPQSALSILLAALVGLLGWYSVAVRFYPVFLFSAFVCKVDGNISRARGEIAAFRRDVLLSPVFALYLTDLTLPFLPACITFLDMPTVQHLTCSLQICSGSLTPLQCFRRSFPYP